MRAVKVMERKQIMRIEIVPPLERFDRPASKEQKSQCLRHCRVWALSRLQARLSEVDCASETRRASQVHGANALFLRPTNQQIDYHQA